MLLVVNAEILREIPSKVSSKSYIQLNTDVNTNHGVAFLECSKNNATLVTIESEEENQEVS